MTADGTLLDKAIDGVKGLTLPACIKDSALRYFFVNDAYCRLMRRPQEDFIGWGSYQLTGIIEDVEREDKERRALVFGSEEAIACRIDGSPTQHRLHCERFVTEDDAIYLYEVFEEQQVTKADQDWQRREQELIEAKAAREALIAEQESLLQSLPFGVLLLNRERVFEYVNDAFYALWDVDRKINLKGQPYRFYLEHNYNEGLSDYGSASFDEVYADRLLFLDGEEPVDTFQVHNRNGKILLITKNRLAGGKLLLTLSDITENRQRETELAGLLARAEAAEQAKSEFLANMSHEIRTPMNGVLGMAELLSRSGLNARQKTFTDVIVKSANALLTIINDIIDVSRLDAGDMSLRHAPFQPSEAVEDVASLLAAEAQDKGIELILDIKPEAMARVVGDAGRFRQIVISLMGNAVKYTESGHILVELNLTGSAGETPQLLLKVSDSGIGIAPENLGRIFEKFNHAGSSNIRRHEGTGLGLSITSGLVQLFGGSITATSTLNVGSCFTVCLPTDITEPHQQSILRRYDGTRPSILTVGGSDIGHRVLLDQLTSWGIDAHHAVDGEMGLAILREAESIGFLIDAVIIDHQLDAPEDLKIARSIRHDNDLHDIGVILITSMSQRAQTPTGQDHFIDLVMSRPVRTVIMQRALTELLLEKKRQIVPSTNTAQYQTEATARPDILIAEDNEVDQIVFSQILQQNGLSYRIVSDGEQAVDAWQRQRPSAILMDISMPHMNGFAATRMIRQIEQEAGLSEHVTIIGVTALHLETERDLCLNAGMDDYISKPVSPDLLTAKIGQWLEKQMQSIEPMRSERHS